MMELFLFVPDDLGRLPELEHAGITGLVVDLERRGKDERQSGFDTQISTHTIPDIARITGATTLPVLCRINGVHPGTDLEVEGALEGGATEVLVPMVRHRAELEYIIDLVDGRCRVGTMIETREAVDEVHGWVDLPLSRAFLGLNDLHIELGSAHLFRPLADGHVDRVRRDVGDIPFGFAGLTLPELGHPLGCQHLIRELARLDCRFTFLRRSFYRDVAVHEVPDAIERIERAVEAARLRTPHEVRRHHRSTIAAIDALPGPPWHL